MTRPTRSTIHMLNTFATRMEIDHGPKDAVKAIQLFTKDRTIRRAEKRDFQGEDVRNREDARIAQQRNTFVMVPDTPSMTRLKETMLQRAYDLLWDGDPSGCDALIEFLPSADVDKMMESWSNDFDGEQPKSAFYDGKRG